MHALNNVLGMKLLEAQDMSLACDGFLVSMRFEGVLESRANHENPYSGFYSEAVMTYALQQKQNIFEMNVNRPILPGDATDAQRIYGENVMGVIVNQNQFHWVALRVLDHQIWLLDSLHDPVRLTFQQYLGFLEKYRNAFLVLQIN